MDALQNHALEVETLSLTSPNRTRGPIFGGAVCPSLEDKLERVQREIKDLEYVEENMGGLAGKNNHTMDSEDVRLMARGRVNETRDHSKWLKLAKLHELRLQRTELKSELKQITVSRGP
ncbi:hypothetical protein ARMGADRAFT_481620 [Armillaria gallica]|uniref:Uncharacterized protein n=1 Tax=Armillaria gallica TaxID=47427 RepID=A0A2H3DRL6_ARMGA|nr:hypothetical protein ARMGADRAFT_185637 [Armillaria gallica]PBK98859.1 hypothetical protein ARMGADRAFT_481620 [Armillaria gallica]